MEPTIPTAFMNNLQEQRKPVALRAPWCNADNCYRALFPCPSPSAVTEAVSYCVTVSADSATNYPTRAIAACGTGKERYISACSCPATNCPVGSMPETITQDTAPLVITTTTVEKGSSENDSVVIVTQGQAPVTVNNGGATSIQVTIDGVVEPDRTTSSRGSADVSVVIELTTTPHTSSYYVPSTQSTEAPTAKQGKSVTKSQSSASSLSHNLLSKSLPMPLGQSSGLTSLSLSSSLSQAGSKIRSATSSGRSSPTKTSLSAPGIPSTMNKAHEGLDTGLVVAIAVGSTLAALLLLGIAIYCCLKRRRTARKGARLRALTLSGKDTLSRGFDAPFEWKPPVELPHQTVTTSRAELEDTLIPHAQPNDSASQGAPATPSSLSAYSSIALRDAAEMQGASPRLSPVELFVMPAELPGVYKNRD
ncbi:hypothetical protein F5Y09DRAFT_352206 [Xylaria sp. FL1042]|nr:hypothetical protein F5Y09DRAFT_352206 [Xylaria sp. FL1042]